MHATRKLWTWLAVICALSFGVLLWVGSEIYLSAPPIPQQVVSKDGKVLYTREQIQQGQEAWLAAMFWLMNIGLAMMVFMSLVPAGIYQAAASISKGMWFARSPEVVHSSFMESLVWLRVPGDVVFALGAVCLAIFAVRLLTGGREPQTSDALAGQATKTGF